MLGKTVFIEYFAVIHGSDSKIHGLYFLVPLLLASFIRHLVASSSRPVASYSCTSRSTASDTRIFPCAGILACALHSSYPVNSSGSASAYFFWPASAPPRIDLTLNVIHSSGVFFSRISKYSRRTGSAAFRLLVQHEVQAD